MVHDAAEQPDFTKLFDQPVESWPNFEIRWDLDPSNFHYAADGAGPQPWPTFTIVQDVELKKVIALLRRNLNDSPPETWRQEKGTRLMQHLYSGGKVTPIWVALVGSGIDLAGGQHRFTLCRRKRLEKIPVLIEKMQRERFEELLRGIS
jgi:hypothetical protein